MIAFLKDSADETKINELKTGIQKLSGISAVVFTSKDEALAKYRKQNENDPLLLEMVTSGYFAGQPGSPLHQLRSPAAGCRNPKTQDIVEEVSFP